MLTRYISDLSYIFCQDYIVYLVFILPSIVTYITLRVCYKTAFYYDRFPEWVYSPWISFTGVNAPESTIFSVGLTLAGISIYFANYMFTTKLMSKITNSNHLNFALHHLVCHKYVKYAASTIIDCILSYNLIIAAIALSIQSIINVDNQQVLRFLSPSMQTMSFFPDWNSKIHIGCASVFFFGFVLFHNMCVILTFNFHQNKLLLYSFIYKIIIQFVCCVAGLTLFWEVYYTSYIVDPYQQNSKFRFGVNAIGFCQYTATICNCLFAGSYGLDYYAITLENHQTFQTKKSN